MHQIFEEEKRRARRQSVYSKTLLLAKAKRRDLISKNSRNPIKSATCPNSILTIVLRRLEGVGDRFRTTDERMSV